MAGEGAPDHRGQEILNRLACTIALGFLAWPFFHGPRVTGGKGSPQSEADFGAELDWNRIGAWELQGEA